MNYKAFIRHYPKEATFGISAALFSSFGQTFFIALFIPMMAVAAGITEGVMGMIYAAATIASASLLPWIGAWIDRVRLLPYTTMVIAGLGAACGLAASVQGMATLFIALLGLRLFGQGLISHVAITAMAKRFKEAVGRPLGLVSIGFPAGEAVLPVLAGTAIALIGWRTTWLVAAVSCVVLVLPLLLWSGKPLARELGERAAEQKRKGETPRKTHAWHYLLNGRFLALLPFGLVIPFVMTAIFLFQTSLGTERGWRGEWIAYSITVFAIVRAIASVGIGPVIDSIGALRLMAVSLVPLAFSLLVLGLADAPWVLPIYLALAGASMGMASNLKTAAMLEVFGEREIGAIRSLSSALMVFSTAASPLLIGILREADVAYEPLIFGGLILVIAVALFTWIAGNALAKT